MDDADRAKATLETHRFTMRFDSFADLMAGHGQHEDDRG
jgi:hypothetical protein